MTIDVSPEKGPVTDQPDTTEQADIIASLLDARKEAIVIRPVAKNQVCGFDIGTDPTGKRRPCPYKATMKLNDKPLCDKHAELQMIAACGRNVKIDRRPSNR